MGHIQGGYWIARMNQFPDINYDDVIRRLLLVIKAEEESERPRYIEVSDFMIFQLIRIYFLFKEKINVSTKVWKEVEEQFRNYTYAAFFEPMSENHKINSLSSEIIAAYLFPEHRFYDGLKGKDKVDIMKVNIKRFLTKRLKYGWSEFDSIGYYNIDFCALLNIYDFQPDEELKHLAWSVLNAMLVDLLHHSVNGYVGGAKGRVYFGTISDNTKGVYWPLYICTGYPENACLDYNWDYSETFFATSNFRPDPEVVKLAASTHNEPDEVKERNILNTMPDDEQVKGSIKRYNYVTPDYVLGSIVQRDEYEPMSFHAWLAAHQELSWSMVFANNPRAVIFSGHPGHEKLKDFPMHQYWMGDTYCVCGRYLQNKNVLIGMNCIEDTKQLQWTHFYIPIEEFDDKREKYGWLLLKCGNTITAIKPLPGYHWTTNGEWANKEIIVMGSHTAFVLEVFDAMHNQMDELIEQLKDRSIGWCEKKLEYTSTDGTNLELNFDGDSFVNGERQDFSNYPLFQSRNVYSEWGSGKIAVGTEVNKTILGIE